MPAAAVGNKFFPIPQPRVRVENDRFGVSVMTLEEIIPDAQFPAALRGIGSVHPRFTAMAVSRRTAERMDGKLFWKVIYTYEGFMISLPEPTYELNGSLNQEPIQLHKNFADLAGTAADPANNAVFVDPSTGLVTTDADKGVFREFGKGELMGVDSFLDPGATWSVTFFTISPPSLRELGKIDTPDGPRPSLPGRNWLCFEQSQRKRGYIYEIRVTWKLSGRGGWNSQIY